MNELRRLVFLALAEMGVLPERVGVREYGASVVVELETVDVGGFIRGMSRTFGGKGGIPVDVADPSAVTLIRNRLIDLECDLTGSGTSQTSF